MFDSIILHSSLVREKVYYLRRSNFSDKIILLSYELEIVKGYSDLKSKILRFFIPLWVIMISP